MSKRKQRYNNPQQLSLFDQVVKQEESVRPVEVTAALPGKKANESDGGSLNMSAQFRHALSEAVRQAGGSKWVAYRLSVLTGRNVSVSKLNSWKNTPDHLFPAELLTALVQITNNPEPLRVLASPVDLYIVESPDAVRANISQLDETIKKLQKEKHLMQAKVRTLEEK